MIQFPFELRCVENMFVSFVKSVYMNLWTPMSWGMFLLMMMVVAVVVIHDCCIRHSALYPGEACWFKLETTDTGELFSVCYTNSVNMWAYSLLLHAVCTATNSFMWIVLCTILYITPVRCIYVHAYC